MYLSVQIEDYIKYDFAVLYFTYTILYKVWISELEHVRRHINNQNKINKVHSDTGKQWHASNFT